MNDHPELCEHLIKYQPAHLREHLEALAPPQREKLLESLSRVNFPLMGALFQEYKKQSAAEGGPCPDVAPLDAQDSVSLNTAGGVENEEAFRLGADYLAAGRLAVVLLAGGVGSRLNFSLPKGMFPITPVAGRTLFEVHFEKIRLLQQKHAVALRVYVMTSRATHEETQKYLAENDYFGFPAERVMVFQQGEMPAFSQDTGEIFLETETDVYFGPDGHGGLLTALERSGSLADMEDHGVEAIFTFHVDNPLVPVAEPELLGHHLMAESEMSLVVVEKDFPQERVGNVVRRRDGEDGIFIVEYMDFPDHLAGERAVDGRLKYWAGSIGIHIIDLALVRRMLEKLAKNPLGIPWHFPLKKMSTHGGSVWAIKPERFLFDILPYARFPLVLAVDREEVFATLKDDAEVVMAQLSALYKKWLRSAGAHFSPDAVVEITPTFARNEQELRARILPGTVLEGEKILL